MSCLSYESYFRILVDKIPLLRWAIHMSRNGSVPSVFSSIVNWIAITCHSLTRSYKYWVMETMTQSMLGIRQKYVIGKREFVTLFLSSDDEDKFEPLDK